MTGGPTASRCRGGYVKETATFIIGDDLSVLPNVLVTSVNLLQQLRIKDMDAIEELTVDIGKREVVDLLKLSLISKNPLTDFVFEKKPRVDDFNPINQSWLERGDESSDEGRKIVVRALAVLHMLEGESSLSCIDKLYKSISELSPDRYLRSQRVKEELVNAKCAPQFAINGQILPIGEVSLPKYCFNTLRDGLVATSTTPSLKICDPKSCIGDSCSGKGFPKGPSTFMVTDDLVVTPMSSISAVSYLNRSQVPFSDLEERVISVGVKEQLRIKDMDAIEELTVDIGKREVVDLLKLSLISKNPLTDFVFEKKPRVDDFNPINQSWLERGDESSDEDEDFADLLFSFMTLPLGGVLHMLEGESSLSCIDKLYKSISELSPDRYLRSQRVKEELVNAKCAPQFAINGQILPIGEVSLPKYCFNTLRDGLVATSTTPSLKICDPKSCIGDSCSGKGFPKGPSTFMVTDDLVVTPMSSISAVSYLNRSQVPFSDLEERVISVGVKEGLAILKASLTSTSALTQVSSNNSQKTLSLKLKTWRLLRNKLWDITEKDGLGLSKASLTSTFALTERLKHLIRPIPSCLKLYTGF
ncbi:hypothetical protein LR48_Vigan03g111500 [Vigna angularis]|uniref:Uncharacterized protein n=1 Tax=Phaseolus angularis TaxID=3914 RepID=A0A0L9U4I3_PHAAN|nr:hypothetical protein LR48_Vigan03g111500 [Vigna angularis]